MRFGPLTTAFNRMTLYPTGVSAVGVRAVKAEFIPTGRRAAAPPRATGAAPQVPPSITDFEVHKLVRAPRTPGKRFNVMKFREGSGEHTQAPSRKKPFSHAATPRSRSLPPSRPARALMCSGALAGRCPSCPTRPCEQPGLAQWSS